MIFPNPDNREVLNQMVGIDARQLFEEKRQKLDLTWEAGREGKSIIPYFTIHLFSQEKFLSS